MNGLRCWPGCVAMVIGGEFDGRVITCERLLLFPGQPPEWTYEGEMFEIHVDPPPEESYTGHWFMEAFFDHVLRPLVPPPSADDETANIEQGDEVAA